MEDELDMGIGLFGKVLGDQAADDLREHIASDQFGKEYAAWAAQFAFGTVWSRGVLDPKLKSCAVLGMLIALRQTEEIKYHVRMALADGMSEREIEEVLYLSVPYAGFPAANTAKQAMIEVLREVELERGGQR